MKRTTSDRSSSNFLTRLKQVVFKTVLFSYIRATAFYRLRRRKKLRFETDIAAHCNLNCKFCNHFSPLVDSWFVMPEEFERDFARLSELAGRNNENIDLMGGEPLLHPECTKLMQIARKYFDGPINIVTNGILLEKMPDDFWKACAENNIRIIVTSYPIKLNREKIKQRAKEFSVRLKMRVQVANLHTWCKLPKDIEGGMDIVKNLKLCLVANFCIFLKNGKLSTCCLPLVADRFNNYFDKKFKVADNDYIDIYKVKNIGEIYDFLRKPMPFCRYCKLTAWEVGVEWGVSKKEISEWID